MRLPNVTGVGIGEKAGKPVIKLFVTVSSGSQEDIYPKTLGGFEVVVEETGPFHAQEL